MKRFNEYHITKERVLPESGDYKYFIYQKVKKLFRKPCFDCLGYNPDWWDEEDYFRPYEFNTKKQAETAVSNLKNYGSISKPEKPRVKVISIIKGDD
jgi:hypothetical protein